MKTGKILTYDSGRILSQLDTLRIRESGVYVTRGGKEYHWGPENVPPSKNAESNGQTDEK